MKKNTQCRVIDIAASEGVEAIYGITDVFFLDFHRYAGEAGIKMVGPRHESAAAMMAIAHARMTGKAQMCMAQAGPGVTNILPGVSIAHFDKIPLVVVASCRSMTAQQRAARGFFQSAPQIDLFRPITKYQATVQSPETVDEVMIEAFRQANAGVPGPVFVQIPTDVMWEEHDYAPVPPSAANRAPKQQAADNQLTSALTLIRESKCPLILAGTGINLARGHDRLLKLAKHLNCPVVPSWGGRGTYPENDEQFLMFGSGANDACAAADLVIAIGTSIGEQLHFGHPPRWGELGKQKWIHIEKDAGSIGVNRPIDAPLVGDLNEILDQLNSELQDDLEPRTAPKQMRQWRKKQDDFLNSIRKDVSTADPIHPGRLAVEIRKAMPDNAIAIQDGGCTAMWAQYYYEQRSHDYLWTPHIGHLGIGIPYAIGAATATNSDRPVIVFNGDGSFGFHAMEIETAVRHELSIIVVVFVDNQWGMELVDIHASEYSKVPDSSFSNPRVDKLAEALGAHGEYVEKYADIAPALKRALKTKGPSVLHVAVDPAINTDENELPYWDELMSWWQADGYGYGQPPIEKLALETPAQTQEIPLANQQTQRCWRGKTCHCQDGARSQ